MDRAPAAILNTDAEPARKIAGIAPLVPALVARHMVAPFNLKDLCSAYSAPLDWSSELVAHLLIKRGLTAQTVAMPRLSALEADALPAIGTRDLVSKPG